MILLTGGVTGKYANNALVRRRMRAPRLAEQPQNESNSCQGCGMDCSRLRGSEMWLKLQELERLNCVPTAFKNPPQTTLIELPEWRVEVVVQHAAYTCNRPSNAL